MHQVSASCDSYDLTIRIKKTEVVYQPAPEKPYKEPTITVKGQRLQAVDKFTYLGSTLSRIMHIDDEVNARVASAACGRLLGSIWDRSRIRRHQAESPQVRGAANTNIPMQNLDSLPTAKRLNHFRTSCLRKLLKIKWQDRFPDIEVLKKKGCGVYILF